MIDNSTLLAESFTALPASNSQLIFLVFISSSISTVVCIDSIVGGLKFLNSKIVKLKMLLKKSPLLQLDLLDILSSQNFLFTSFTTFSVFLGGKTLEISICSKNPLHQDPMIGHWIFPNQPCNMYIHLFTVIKYNLLMSLLANLCVLTDLFFKFSSKVFW